MRINEVSLLKRLQLFRRTKLKPSLLPIKKITFKMNTRNCGFI